MRIIEFEPRLGIVIENQDGPLLVALMAILTACRPVRLPELTVMDVLVTDSTGAGGVHVAPPGLTAFLDMAFVAFGFEMSSD